MFGRLACAYFASTPGAVKDKVPSLLCIIGCEASKKNYSIRCAGEGWQRDPRPPRASTLKVISQYAKEGTDVCSVTPLPFFKLNNKLNCVSTTWKKYYTANKWSYDFLRNVWWCPFRHVKSVRHHVNVTWKVKKKKSEKSLCDENKSW